MRGNKDGAKGEDNRKKFTRPLQRLYSSKRLSLRAFGRCLLTFLS